MRCPFRPDYLPAYYRLAPHPRQKLTADMSQTDLQVENWTGSEQDDGETEMDKDASETEPASLSSMPPELLLVLIKYLYCDVTSLLKLSETRRSFRRLLQSVVGIAGDVCRLNYGLEGLESMPFLNPGKVIASWTPFSYLKRVLAVYGKLLGFWHGDVPAYDGRFLAASVDPDTGNIIGYEREALGPEARGPRGQTGAMAMSQSFSLNPGMSMDVLLENGEFTQLVAKRGGILFSIIVTDLGGEPIAGRLPVNCHGIRPGSRHARALGPASTLHPVKIDWGGRGWAPPLAEGSYDPARILARLLGLPDGERPDETVVHGFPDAPFGPPTASGLFAAPRANAVPERLLFTTDANNFLSTMSRSETPPDSPNRADDIFTVNCAIHSRLPIVAIRESGDIARATYQTRWSRIKLPAPDSARPFKEGIWLGTYGSHGLEYLLGRISTVGDDEGPRMLEFTKITGDSNVPRGQVSLYFYLTPLPPGSARRLAHSGNTVDLSRSLEFGGSFSDEADEFEPLVYKGRATVAMTAFSSPSAIEATIVLLNAEGTDVAVLWHDLENVGRMRWVG